MKYEDLNMIKMNRKQILLGSIGFLCSIFTLPVFGQTTSSDFDTFRKGLLDEFQKERKRIYDDYHTFLAGVWRDYETFRAAPSPFVVPKPGEQPRLPKDEQALPDVAQPMEPNIPERPIDIPEKETPPVSVPKLKPEPVQPIADGVTLSFYGASLRFPRVKPVVPTSLQGRDLAVAWSELAASATVRSAMRDLSLKAQAMNLPDWYVLELVNAFAIEVSGGVQTDASVLLVQYILTNMGYDVRLGRSDKGLLILVNMQQMVYARNFVTINDTRYYICLQDDCETLSSCDLPIDADYGRGFDLVVRKAPNIPNRDKEFTVGNGQLRVTATVDANLMEMFRHYPQMPIPCYAASSLQGELRNSIVSQLKSQVQGLPQIDAVNAILHFVQSAFDYATDDEQFGYEKPFFLEELFYWPQCDCEDRSILYVYLLRECLGLDTHLINYPGHECASVSLNGQLNGYYYDYEGKRFYISDPTYIGAETGMCMPDYQSTPPKIEKWY